MKMTNKEVTYIGVIGSIASIIGLLLFFYPENNSRNGISSSINLGNNSNIITHAGGKTIIKSSINENIINSEIFDKIKKLGVAENAINNFLNILKKEKVPVNQWEIVLNDIAKRHISLTKRLKDEVKKRSDHTELFIKIKHHIDNLEYDLAETLINKLIINNNEKSIIYLNKIKNYKDKYIKEQISLSHNYANIADISSLQFNFNKSAKNYEKAIEVLENLNIKFNIKKEEYLSKYNYNSAMSYFYMEDYARSRVNLLKALNITDIDIILKINIYINLAYVSLKIDKNNIASINYLKLIKKHLESYKDKIGNINMASFYNQIGMINYSLGNEENAYKLYSKAKNICMENNIKTTGCAGALGNLGSYYFHKSKFEISEKYTKKAIVILKKEVGEKNPLIASNITNLAEIYRINKKYPEAIETYNQAIDILLNSKGIDHSETITPYNGIAHVYLMLGDCINAEKYYNKILTLKIKNKVSLKNYPSIFMLLENQAECYHDNGNTKKQILAYNKLLEYMRNIKDVSYKDKIKYLRKIQNIQFQDKEYKKLILTLSKIRKIYHENKKLSEDIDVVLNLDLAHAYSLLFNYSKSLKIYKKEIKKSKKTFSKDDPIVIIINNNISGYYARVGKIKKALEYINKNIDIMKKSKQYSKEDIFITVAYDNKKSIEKKKMNHLYISLIFISGEIKIWNEEF